MLAGSSREHLFLPKHLNWLLLNLKVLMPRTGLLMSLAAAINCSGPDSNLSGEAQAWLETSGSTIVEGFAIAVKQNEYQKALETLAASEWGGKTIESVNPSLIRIDGIKLNFQPVGRSDSRQRAFFNQLFKNHRGYWQKIGFEPSNKLSLTELKESLLAVRKISTFSA